MILLPPSSTRTDSLFPYPPLFRSCRSDRDAGAARQLARLLVAELHVQADRPDAHRNAAVVLQAQVYRPAAVGAHRQLLAAGAGFGYAAYRTAAEGGEPKCRRRGEEQEC